MQMIQNALELLQATERAFVTKMRFWSLCLILLQTPLKFHWDTKDVPVNRSVVIRKAQFFPPQINIFKIAAVARMSCNASVRCATSNLRKILITNITIKTLIGDISATSESLNKTRLKSKPGKLNGSKRHR